MTLPTSVESIVTGTLVDDILDDDELLEEIVRLNELYGEEDDDEIE